MKRLFFGFIVLLLLGIKAVAADAPANDSQRQARVTVLREEAEKICRNFLQALKNDKLHGHATRELTHVAHDMFVLGQDPNEAQALVERAFADQEMDPRSPRYGTVPWAVGVHAQVEDPNAIEFTCLPTGAIMTRYRSQLSPQFISSITPHIKAALAAVRRHNVSVGYTNIYLMRISNLLLLGESIGDDAAVQLGLANLDRWIDYTRQNGIGEFNSPTYFETQINSANVAYTNTSSPEARARLGAVLDFLWADACASYYPPTQQLAGASSRDYDFMYGTGPMDRYFYIEGLRDQLPTPSMLNDISGAFCDAVESPYRPPAPMLALARQTDKTLVSGYGPEPWMDRTLYSTAAFSVGSAGALRAQDREIGIRFGSERKLPIVSVFLDPFDSPDGSIRVQDKENHSKPGHIKLIQAIAQDKGSILAVYDLAANVGKTPYSTLGLNLILPANTDGLWLDGKKIDGSDTTAHPCTGKSVVVVREGKAALMARIFGIGGFNGFEPTYFLKHDIAHGNAFRLVAYAYQGESTPLADKHVPGAAVIDVSLCDTDEAFAKFLSRSQSLASVELRQEKNIWHTAYGPLEVALDSDTDVPAVRHSHGVDVHTAGPAQVNGWDLGDLLVVHTGQTK